MIKRNHYVVLLNRWCYASGLWWWIGRLRWRKECEALGL